MVLYFVVGCIMTIFERIKTLRKEKGLTQTDLAKAIGYKDKSVISHIERGEQNLYQDKIKAIADALGVSPGYLINGYDEKDEKLNKLVDIYNQLSDENKNKLIELAELYNKSN